MKRHILFDRFCYVHIPKTGGTSVEKALGLPHRHDHISTWRLWYGNDNFERRFKFTVVRNPWDLNVSLYHFRRSTSQLPYDVDFSDWLRLVYIDGNPQFYAWPHWERKGQFWWISDENGKCLADFVARFEILSRDWAFISQNVGRSTSLPHLNSSNRRKGYCKYYSAADVDIIATAYSKDIEEFGTI